jgi:transcription termination factor NusB
MKMQDLISVLLHSVTQTHVFHLQTKSYAEHNALGSFFDDMTDLVDSLAEGYQGKYGILEYKNVSGLKQYESKEQVIEYIEKLVGMVESTQSDADSFISNYLDEIVGLMYSTIYKLKNLG